MPRGRPPGAGKKAPARPQPLEGMPKSPKGLGRIARATWKEVIRVVAPSGLLTQADAFLIEQFCVAYETWVTARKELERPDCPAVVTGKNGGFYPNPMVMIRDRACEEMTVLMEKLGMDPPSRQKLEVDVGPKLADGNEKARFFKAREETA